MRGRPTIPQVSRTFQVPVDLDEWLERKAHPHGRDAYTPEGTSRSATVVRALRLLRELEEGVPSPVSSELLDRALDRLNLSMADTTGGGR